MFSLSSSFLNIGNIVTISVRISLTANPKISAIFWIGFGSIFSFIRGHIAWLLCMPSNFLLVAKHCRFYSVDCWVFLYSFKYSQALFWEVLSYLEMVSYLQVMI